MNCVYEYIQMEHSQFYKNFQTFSNDQSCLNDDSFFDQNPNQITQQELINESHQNDSNNLSYLSIPHQGFLQDQSQSLMVREHSDMSQQSFILEDQQAKRMFKRQRQQLDFDVIEERRRESSSKGNSIAESQKYQLQKSESYMSSSDESNSSQSQNPDNINVDSQESYIEKLKKELPANIVNLLIQPHREGVNFQEFEENTNTNQDRGLFSVMKDVENVKNQEEIDNELLQQALQQNDNDLTSFLAQKVNLKAQQDKMPCMIFSYKSKCKMWWDLLAILFALYNCVMIPIQVAYGNEFFTASAIEGINYLEIVLDVFFCLDIGCSFRTTYLNPQSGKEVTSQKLIAKRYVMTGNLFMDIISTVPIDTIIEKTIEVHVKQIGLLGLIKMTRMLRLRKIITFLNVQQSLKASLRMVQLIMMLLLMVHWVGCIWWALVDPNSFPNQTRWIPVFEIGSGATSLYDDGTQYQYLVTIYYGVISLIGRANEMAPVSFAQTIFCALVIIIGSFVSTFIFGNIAATMENATKKDSKLQERMSLIQSTMVYIKLPVALQDEVIKYMIQVEQAPEVQQDLSKFLDSLSPGLKAQILNNLHHRVMSNLSELKEADETEVNFLAFNLKTILVLPTDTIIQQGTTGQEMYFIITGQVETYLIKLVKESKVLQRDPSQNFTIEDLQPKSPNDHALSDDSSNEVDKDKQTFQQVSKTENRLISNSIDQSALDANPARRTSFVRQEVSIGTLDSRKYFGEISLFTRLKRTATVKANDYCTLSSLHKDVIMTMKQEFPQIYMNFKSHIGTYTDEEMIFRKKVIRNIPYFKDISEELILELICLLRETICDYATLVVKNGDLSDRIHIVWKGSLRVELFYNGRDHIFERLNKGGCFCVFSAFSADYTQMFDFKVISPQATILSIKTSDLLKLSKTNLELADIMKQLTIQIKNKQKSDFDFFRYYQPSYEYTPEYSRFLRLRFKKIMLVITKQLREKTVQIPETLQVIQEICRQRKLRDALLKKILLKKKDSNPEKEKQKNLPPQLRHKQSSKETFTLTSNNGTLSSKYDQSNPIYKELMSEMDLERMTEKGVKLMKETDRKKKRLDLLKDIINPLDVPGVDLRIFEKIDGLPKDKNMYAVRTIEKFENLQARIAQQAKTKENIQFLNKLIFKQTSQIHEVKLQFDKYVQESELKLAQYAQHVRQSKKILRDKALLHKQHNILQQEEIQKEYFSKQDKSFYDIKQMMSFQRGGKEQINIKNQINNIITISGNELSGRESNFLSNTDLQTQEEKYPKTTDHDNQLSHEEETLSEISPTVKHTDQEQPNKKQVEVLQDKEELREQLRKKLKMQRRVSKLESRTPDIVGKHQKKDSLYSPPQIEKEYPQLQPQEDLGDVLSKVADLALKRSKVVDSPRSYQRYIKDFGEKSRFKHSESKHDLSKSLFMDGGGGSIEDEESKQSNQDMHAEMFRQLSLKRSESRLSKMIETRIQYKKLKMMPLPQRPFTRDQSRMGKTPMKIDDQTEAQSQTHTNYLTQAPLIKMTTMDQVPSTVNIDKSMNNMDSKTQMVSVHNHTVSSNFTIRMQNQQTVDQSAINLDFQSNEKQNNKDSSHQLFNIMMGSATKMNNFESLKKRRPKPAKSQSPNNYLNRAKLNKEDRERWTFYRNMIDQSKKKQ